MATFSERYGYVQPSTIIVRETITKDIQNAICNCLYQLNSDLVDWHSLNSYRENPYILMDEYIWMYFLNKKKTDFWSGSGYSVVAEVFILDDNHPWYKKLDLLEFIINYLAKTQQSYNASYFFISNLNKEFKRLNFGYRIIDEKVVEVTSEEEIVAIETAINSQKNNIKIHLQKALELFAKKPQGDYQNSIKESISAVEAFCREVTGESTLGKALAKLESSGLVLHPMLKSGFEKLYFYTNDEKTGIRHSLMDTTGSYTPTSDEAILMLVLCSSFINYLEKKRT